MMLAMTLRLTPCVRCSRHVKSDAAACPFCGAGLAARAVAAAPSRTAAERLSRAALFAATVGVAAAVTDCSSVTPVYGAPVPPDDASSTSDSTSPAPDASTMTSEASAPDASDAASPVDTGTATEDAPAMQEEIPTAQPLYGAPVMPVDASHLEDSPSVVALYGGFAPPDSSLN
jgi:hypothetical protein